MIGPNHIQQRGIAALWVAVSLTALLAAVALVLDLGRVYQTQRDLQRLADLAALDVATATNGCQSNQGDIRQAALESLRRNGGQVSDLAAVRSGRRTLVGGEQVFIAADTPQQDPNFAVQVQVIRRLPPRLFGLAPADQDSLTHIRAQAAAQSRLMVLTDVGISEADFASGLSQLSNGAINTAALQRFGLSRQQVSLAELAGSNQPAAVSNFLFEASSPRRIVQEIRQALSNSNQREIAATLAPLEGLLSDVGGLIPAELLGLSTEPLPSGYEALKVNLQTLLSLLLQAEVRRNTLTTNSTTVQTEFRSLEQGGRSALGRFGDLSTPAQNTSLLVETRLRLPLATVLGLPDTLPSATLSLPLMVRVTPTQVRSELGGALSQGCRGESLRLPVEIQPGQVEITMPPTTLNLNTLGVPVQATVALTADSEPQAVQSRVLQQQGSAESLAILPDIASAVQVQLQAANTGASVTLSDVELSRRINQAIQASVRPTLALLGATDPVVQLADVLPPVPTIFAR